VLYFLEFFRMCYPESLPLTQHNTCKTQKMLILEVCVCRLSTASPLNPACPITTKPWSSDLPCHRHLSARRGPELQTGRALSSRLRPVQFICPRPGLQTLELMEVTHADDAR